MAASGAPVWDKLTGLTMTAERDDDHGGVRLVFAEKDGTRVCSVFVKDEETKSLSDHWKRYSFSLYSCTFVGEWKFCTVVTEKLLGLLAGRKAKAKPRTARPKRKVRRLKR